MAVAFKRLERGASVVPAAQLAEHVRQLLRMRLVAGEGIRITSVDRHGTALEVGDAGGGHGTAVSGAAARLADLFKPGCVPLTLCRRVMELARTLPALGGRGVAVSQTGAGRQIELADEGGGDLPSHLNWDALFRSVDAFVDDWNALIDWAAGMAPRAGNGVTVSHQADRTLVTASIFAFEEAEEVISGCDGCDLTCDPCDPCDPCDNCDPCDAVCDPCDPCQADWCGEVDPYQCSP